MLRLTYNCSIKTWVFFRFRYHHFRLNYAKYYLFFFKFNRPRFVPHCVRTFLSFLFQSQLCCSGNQVKRNSQSRVFWKPAERERGRDRNSINKTIIQQVGNKILCMMAEKVFVISRISNVNLLWRIDDRVNGRHI